MNAGQLADLLAAVRPGRKTDPFTTGDPTDWRNWRDNFALTVNINGWNHQRARREAAAAMQGEAKSSVRDIPVADGAGALNYNELLDLYEARFVTAAAGDLARSQLKAARQSESETILAWHSRLRELFIRAHPEMNAAAIAASLDLRDSFILGLSDNQVKTDTWRARPATFAAALTDASNVQAGMVILQHHQTGATVKTEPGLNQVGGAPPGGAGCYLCDKPHFLRDCPIRRDLLKKGFNIVGRGGGRGNWRGDKGDTSRFNSAPRGAKGRGAAARGRGGGRGRGGRGRGDGNSTYRGVHQLDDASSAETATAEYAEDCGEPETEPQGNE